MMDEEECVASPERIKALGFKPQKEIMINNLLPFADQLDDESTAMFAQIKSNLGKAVMLREIKPGCAIWSSRLIKYLRIYGLKFSKEDHISLIKMVFELILIPDLEPSKLHKFSTLFIMLTKKKYLISPEELTLPWRPLYEMGQKVFNKSRTHIGMYHYLTSLEASFLLLVKCAKPYFALSATQEILDELLPQISPWSSDSHKTMQLVILLPVSLHPHHAAIGHELWFDKIMTLWNTCHNSQCGVAELLVTFSYLAKRNPGSVDWTPYVPTMFTRFLHSLNLPVSYKDMVYSKTHNLEIKQMASWIVWTITPDGLVLKHLRSFLASVESYLHSANSGRWSFKLRELLRKLSRDFLNRVRREQNKKFLESWENKTPDHLKLRQEDITEFVQILLEPTIQAVHSRSGPVEISMALQSLATLRPALVIPPLIERLETALESLTEPHRVTAAMQAVAAVARPLLRGPQADYPEGPTHVIPLLLAALPGLDPNDIKKTLVTLHFILIFTWMVPLIDCSNASEFHSDLTENERLTCASTAQCEDFVLLFFERLFGIIESSSLENVRLESNQNDALRSKTESVIEVALSSAATSVLMQSSPKIFKQALRKFKNFATTSTFETNVAGGIVGGLLRVFARVDARSTLSAILPQLIDEIGELLSADEILLDENPPRELQYRLLLLSYIVEGNGSALISYIPMLIPILDKALKLRSKDAMNRACETLARILTSLTMIELKEFKSSSNDYGEAPANWLPIRHWGQGCPLMEAKFDWHIPSQDAAKVAQSLIERYALPEMLRLRQWIDGERPMCRKRRLRSLLTLNAILCCEKGLPVPKEPAVPLIDSLVPPTEFRLVTGIKHEITLQGENLRLKIIHLMLDVQAKMLEESSDDTKSFEILIQIWERVSGLRTSRTGPHLEARMRSYAALERALDGRGGPPGDWRIRTLLSDAIRLQEDLRWDLQTEVGIGETGLLVLNALYQLSINTYTSIRILAQVRLYLMLSYYAYSYRALIPRIAELLQQGGEGDEWHARRKGALYILLGPRSGPLVAKLEWEVAKLLWPAVLNSPLSEKPSIVKLEQLFSDILHRQFPTVNTRLTVTESCVEAAKVLLTTEDLNDPEFIKNFNESKARETATSDKNERVYWELNQELVNIAESPNIQWRRLELVMQMLTYCPSLQTLYLPSVVRLIVNSLIHDNIGVRRTAVKLTHFALKQRKIRTNKITIDPYELAGVSRPAEFVPGYRKDIEWAMWTEDGEPKDDEEWAKPWLRNKDCGFYSWPDKITVAAPYYKQEPFQTPEEMDEGMRFIYNFFNNEDNVEKLIGFMTVEEKKGKDKFHGGRFSMFRCLFRCFGYNITSRFLAHALTHAGSSQEAPQRFASEIVAAAIRAPRYWDRQSALAIYDEAIKVLQLGLTSVTPETMEDWGTALASAVESLDPRRGSRILSALVDICAPQAAAIDDQNSSFGVCARLYALQGALGTLTWQTAPLATHILKQLEESSFIEHPYQNVRETVGSLLMTLFDNDLVFPGGEPSPAPKLGEFLENIKPKLAALYDQHGEIVIRTSPSVSSVHERCESSPDSCTGTELASTSAGLVSVPVVAQLSPDSPVDHTVSQPPPDVSAAQDSAQEDAIMEPVGKSLSTRLDAGLRIDDDTTHPWQHEHSRAINLLNTVFRGCMGVIARGVNGSTATQYRLVRTACALSARGPPRPHDELARAADSFLASLAFAHHDEAAFDTALKALDDVATSRSWWARLACVEFAQPIVFYGLPLLCQQPKRAARAEQLSIKLMKDHRLEVRQTAAKLLTGLMHCKALPDENNTLNVFMKNCRSKNIVERHCGVLGLCAYLSSRPYSLGPRIGEVLAELSRHTNAPDPIPSSINTALADFKRTHQDDWAKHRESLTEDELDLLADLTSPPSYCA